MARRVLGVLLVAMALGQVSDVGGFVDVVATYEIGGRGIAWLVALGLLAGETVAGVGLLRPSTRSRVSASTFAVGVAVAWSLLGAQAFARGLALENCGCFGVHLAQPLRWWILVEDVEFVALAWWTRRAAVRTSQTGSAAPSNGGRARIGTRT